MIIEESLANRRLLGAVRVTRTRKLPIGEEDMKLHNIEVADSRKDAFIEKAKACMQHGSYMHLSKEDRMVVIFRNKSFEFSRNDRRKMNEARHHGVAMGIPEEQMEFETFFS